MLVSKCCKKQIWIEHTENEAHYCCTECLKCCDTIIMTDIYTDMDYAINPAFAAC